MCAYPAGVSKDISVQIEKEIKYDYWFCMDNGFTPFNPIDNIRIIIDLNKRWKEDRQCQVK